LSLMKPRVKPRAAVIGALKKANHLSTSELARRSGISRQYMSRIEAGLRGASPDVVNRIATALDVTPSMIADEVISAEVVIAEVLGAAEAVSTASVR
jgi:transcriptional regulator with XRE-family HTH domain